LRTTTVILGTVAAAIACKHLRAVADDPRVLDLRADHEAGDVLTRNTSGMLNASQI
jgi:hypothetical protein